MSNRLQVIPSGLFLTQVGGEGCVSRGARQVLALLIWDVLLARIHVEFGEAEVDDVDVVFGGLGAPHHEVVGLDVTVDDSVFVAFLNAVNLNIMRYGVRYEKLLEMME